MITIFDSEKLPARKLRCEQVISTYQARDVGQMIQHARQNMTRRIATMIADDKDVVVVGLENAGQIQLRADLIVLTSEEFRKLMQDQFRAGIDHANGFMKWEPA